MARGPKTKLKRVNAPSHWMLSKMGGIYAPRPSQATHGLNESLPLVLLIRNRLKYALTYREVKNILMGRLVQVDKKVRTDVTFPAGFQDVITIEKTKENYRLLYDTKGRFVVHPITDKEARFKLVKVTGVGRATKGVPYLTTHDGRMIRYPHPEIRVNDTVKLELDSGRICKFVKYALGNLVYVTGGANRGRIGELVKIEKHPGGFTIVNVRDVSGNTFSTRQVNTFVIGPGHKSWISIPKGRGLKLSPIEDRKKKMKAAAAILKKKKGAKVEDVEKEETVEKTSERIEEKVEEEKSDRKSVV